MPYVAQKHKTDCGIAALAMLCGVTYEEADRVIPWRRHGCLYGTDTKMLVAGAKRLGYVGHGTETGQLKRLDKKYRDVAKAEHLKIEHNLSPLSYLIEAWRSIPANSLVKVPNPNGHGEWHWVVWRKQRVYCPARGVYTAAKYGAWPSAYMEFTKEEPDD